MPTRSTDRLLKVATPATALTVVVPVSRPPLGLLPIEMDTAAVDVTAVLP